MLVMYQVVGNKLLKKSYNYVYNITISVEKML